MLEENYFQYGSSSDFDIKIRIKSNCSYMQFFFKLYFKINRKTYYFKRYEQSSKFQKINKYNIIR